MKVVLHNKYIHGLIDIENVPSFVEIWNEHVYEFTKHFHDEVKHEVIVDAVSGEISKLFVRM